MKMSLYSRLSRFSVLLGCLCLPLAAHAARLALVIGNDRYQNINSLTNAVADAESIAGALRKAGYTVTQNANRDLKSFKDDFREFRRRVQGGDEVVVYFSGHGVQLGGENYLLPVDVRSDNEDQVRDDGVALSSLLADLRTTRPALTLAIIDACRNNPFPQKGRNIGGRGLTRVSGATGEMILFAAGEGQQAPDRLGSNDPVRNGLFTRVFVKEMERPGLSVDQVLKNVRIEVNRLAKTVNHEQVPALYDQVLGNFYFYPPVNVNANVVASLGAVPVNAAPAQAAPVVAAQTTPISPPPAYAIANAAWTSPRPVIDGRYQVIGNGSEIKDTTTGLIWQRCSVGQIWTGKTCAEEAKAFTFDDAQRQAGGGWRVPTARELHSLVVCDSAKTKYKDDPDGKGAIANTCDGRSTINPETFPSTPVNYWTSSPVADDSTLAWKISFMSGQMYRTGRRYDGAVRLVRSSQ